MTGSVLYAIQNDTCSVRMDGQLTYILGPRLDAFITWVSQQEHVRNIVVDLTQADYLDSTALGLLARMANLLREQLNGRVLLISPKPDVTKILLGVCFDRVFSIVTGASQPADVTTDIAELNTAEREYADVLLESHQALLEISEENRAAFQDVVACLEK